jgi:hypothetical protein
MNKVEILVICRHEGILQTIVRLVNNNPDWHAIGAVTNNEAITAFDTRPFKLVLLGSGISKESDEKLRSYFALKNPEIAIVQHYGGGSGLLSGEIYEALNKF